MSMGIVLQFAENELRSYHSKINHTFEPDIRLTVSAELLAGMEGADSSLDDAYRISVKNAAGEIVGSNERSVLLGVYKYLTLIGCFFYAPGESGEIIPKLSREQCCAEYTGVASLRHRGVCIEGSVNLDNVRDMIDFLPKVGMNSYFIQFREGHQFFERWYTHESSRYLQPEDYDLETSRSFIRILEWEIRRRGLIYHKIGHGWTCECLGYSSTGWHTTDDSKVPNDVRIHLAQINGVRKFFEDKPLNTHLCYSRKDTRDKFVQAVVDYAAKNRHIDMLHVWLADNFNNLCECDECRKNSLSDFYVMMLNDIDRRLTDLGINTTIVFLIYFELLWPPLHERLNNPDRFVMMFAPLTRTFTESYIEDESNFDKSRYTNTLTFKRNQMEFPRDLSANLALLFEWQKHFEGDSFVFDYHLMWDINRDFGGFTLTKVLYNDLRQIKKLGLNGFISCQINRCTFPSGFALFVLGRTLFDNSVSFETLRDEYFGQVFGENRDTVVDFLQGLSQYFPLKYNRGEFGEYVGKEYADLFIKGKQHIEKFISVINPLCDRMEFTPSGRAYLVLKSCAELFYDAADILIYKASGADIKYLKTLADNFCCKVSRLTPVLQKDLDDFYFMMILNGIFVDGAVKM